MKLTDAFLKYNSKEPFAKLYYKEEWKTADEHMNEWWEEMEEDLSEYRAEFGEGILNEEGCIIAEEWCVEDGCSGCRSGCYDCLGLSWRDFY